jgi:hypothetical protein
MLYSGILLPYTALIFLGEGVTWYEPVGGAIVLLGSAIGQGRIKLMRAGR